MTSTEPFAIPSPSVAIPSNPFATRFTRPGALDYCFDRHPPHDAEGVACSTWRQQHSTSLDQLIDSLAQHRMGLIVGPHGTGKTTLLRTLIPRLSPYFPAIQVLRLTGCQAAGFTQRWRHGRRVARVIGQSLSEIPSEGSLQVIDGAEQIPWLRWRQLLWEARRRNFGVLATSHRPLPRVPVLYRTGLNAVLIRALTGQLLHDASPQIVAGVNEALQGRELDRVSNLRELWFELYDVVQPQLMPTRSHQASSPRDGCPVNRHFDPVTAADRFGTEDG